MILDISQTPAKLSVAVQTTGIRQKIQRVFKPLAAIGALLFLLALVVTAPALPGAFYASAGAHALAAAEANPNDRSQLSAAVGALERARQWSPSDPLIHRQLARAYTLQNQPLAAVAALEEAFRLQPESLLVKHELAFAYEAAGEVERAAAMWARAGVTAERMAKVGDSYLDQNQYRDALQWYNRAARYFSTLSHDILFRRAVASIMAGERHSQALIAEVQEVVTYPTLAGVRIKGANLRSLSNLPSASILYGMPLPQTPAQTNNIVAENSGVLSRSSGAGAIVLVQRPGNYLLRVKVRHRGPPPAEMTLGVNGADVKAFSLDTHDGMWVEVEVPVNLARGLQIVNVRFLNELAVSGGEDRALEVAWIELHS